MVGFPRFTLHLALLSLPLLVTTTAAAPSRAMLPLFERVKHMSALPEGWVQQEVAPGPSTKVRLSLAVRDRHKIDQLYKTVVEVSTPGHQRYGKHLTRDELRALCEPSPAVLRRIRSWLEEAEVNSEDTEQKIDWIDIMTTVGHAEKILNTSFAYFKDSSTNNLRIAAREYSSRNPWRHMYASLSQRCVATERNPCANENTPSCLRELYSLRNRTSLPRTGNRFGVSGFLEQHPSYDDLEKFIARYAPYAAGAKFFSEGIDGNLDAQNPNPTGKSVEANLNIQYAIAMSYGANVIFYSTAGRGGLVPDQDQSEEAQNSNEPYLEQLRHLVDLADDDLPTVLTTSYGEPEQSVPESYAVVACDHFAKLGARGVSVIFSSGDSGVGSSCISNDEKHTTRFNPISPASCPWVTSVGSTADINPERATDFSSGGFSDIFPRPDYQKEAVSQYLSKLGDQWAGLYNLEGRGFPDVAAQGVSFPIYNKGSIISIGGTSASAPTFAGLISQLNDARLAQGKRVIGFLNPWLYSSGYKAFTDIVKGGSKGCFGFDRSHGKKARHVPYAGYNASQGWDPVTGHGTPSFELMLIAMP